MRIESPTDQEGASPAGNNLRIIIAAGVLALLPLIIYRRQFGQLFWFGDEWQLIDEIRVLGFWHWTGQAFAENIVPVFKIIWGGGVFVFNGSYFLMLCALWTAHALNTVLLGRLLLRNGFSLSTTLASQLIFSLTPNNLETLGWTVQLSPVLSTTFLLFSLDHALRTNSSQQLEQKKNAALTVVYSTLSALSFSRGVITGLLTALTCFIPSEAGRPRPVVMRFVFATIFLLPAIAASMLIAALADGNHQHLAGHILDAADFGLWFFCLNPLFSIMNIDSWGIRTLVVIGIIKVALIGWGLLRSSSSQRNLMILFVAFELANAALVGIGRYHTGLRTVVSSRYQYCALITMAPFIASWLETMVLKLPITAKYPRSTGIVCLTLLALFTLRGWSSAIGGFSVSRGTETRHIVFIDPSPAEIGAIPGFPSLRTDQAKMLVKKYNLH